MVISGCGVHSCQSGMKAPAAAPGRPKDAMPQVHPGAQQQQGHGHCGYCRNTAGCSALRKLHRVHPWGNLRLVWTQAPGNCATHPAIRRRLQLCLQGQRQWHIFYGTGPSGRNRALSALRQLPVFTPSWEHKTLQICPVPVSRSLVPSPAAARM